MSNFILIPHHKLVLWSAPKVASTSLKAIRCKMLGIPSAQPHKRCPTMTRQEVLEASRQGLEIVAIVRNPYDRFLSCWKEKVMGMSKDKGGCGKSLSCPRGVSFAEFARRIAMQNDSSLDGHTASQYSMIVRKGVPLYTKLIKVEDIDDEWPNLQEKYPDLPDMVYRNVTPNLDKDPYTDEIRAIVRRRYKKDFQQFGYEY